MTATINFLDEIPRIIEAAGILTDRQLADVDFAQAVFEVAHEEGKSLTPAGQRPNDVLSTHYNSPQKLKEAVDRLGLDRRAINEKAQMFRQGYRAEHAPYFMHTLETFGHIQPNQKNPLLASQFSARTADVILQLKSGRVEAGLSDLLAKPMGAPRPEEPDYLRAAQNTNNMAQLLAASIAENSSLRQKPEIQRAITALELLSAQGFKQAAKHASGPKMNAAEAQMTKGRYGQKSMADAVSNLASTSALVRKVEKGMQAAAAEVAKTDPAQAQEMLDRFGKAKSEMKEFKVVGSLILPNLAMRESELGFVQQEMNRRAQNNGISGQTL